MGTLAVGFVAGRAETVAASKAKIDKEALTSAVKGL